MHVAALMPFTPPPDAPPDHLRAADGRDPRGRGGLPAVEPAAAHARLPVEPAAGVGREPSVDLEYHVRRSALPSPGDERELGILVSRLHGYHVDFHRPPWEVHLIEGLEGGRFALYVKVHHSLVDGFSAMRILANALSTRSRRARSAAVLLDPAAGARAGATTAEGVHFAELMALVREQYGAAKIASRALKRVFDSARAGDHDARHAAAGAEVHPQRADQPQPPLRDAAARDGAAQGGREGGGRHAQRRRSSRCRAGSLRRYLLEQDALPDEPLIAMVPVAVRAKDDEGGGNAVGAILASLATDVDDAGERLAEIIASTRDAKQQLQGMSKAAILQYSALLHRAVDAADDPARRPVTCGRRSTS